MVLDAANLVEHEDTDERRAIIEQAVDLLVERIVMAHAKDRLRDGSFTSVGHGVIDYPHYLQVLERAGFNGNLVTHGLVPHEAPAVAAFLNGILVRGATCV